MSVAEIPSRSPRTRLEALLADTDRDDAAGALVTGEQPEIALERRTSTSTNSAGVRTSTARPPPSSDVIPCHVSGMPADEASHAAGGTAWVRILSYSQPLMDRLTRLRDAAADIVQRLEMTPPEVADRLARARDTGYWRSLAPGLSIGGADAPPAFAVDEERLRAAASQLRHDRYFRTPPLLSADTLASLNRTVDAVMAAGWPAVFAMLYDEPWHCCRLPALARVLEGHFRSGFAQIPHLWVHIVPAVSGAVGWMPHFDGFRQARVSVWLALTDATVDNGCIHIVPPDTLPAVFRTTNIEATIVMSDILKAMQGTRAMPVAAGAALGWEFDVFHWGGRAVNPREARRAISMEFLSSAHPPESDETPLLDVSGPLPAFDERLRIVASALRTYAKREPVMRRFRALADQLAAQPHVPGQ